MEEIDFIKKAISKWSTQDIERRIEESGGYEYLNSLINELHTRKVRDSNKDKENY